MQDESDEELLHALAAVLPDDVLRRVSVKISDARWAEMEALAVELSNCCGID